MSAATLSILLRAFGVLLIALAVFRGITGKFKSEDSIGMTETLDRSRNPVRFWLQLALQAVLGLVLALGVIHP
jgi:hypothetical protein